MSEKKDYTNYNSHLKKTFYQNKIDYKLYNNYYKKNILTYLKNNKKLKIVDLGCGLGQILHFLTKQNYKDIEGVDINKENVKYCINKGYKVINSDIINYLNNLKEKKDVFILSNVIEHFSYEDIKIILDLCYKKLNQKGKIIMILPNCNNVYGLATYFSDITHKSPLNEKSFEDIIIKTKFKKYDFYNLIVYSNIFLIDIILKLFNKFIFNLRKINNLLNGQKPYKVQSKNMLVVLEK